MSQARPAVAAFAFAALLGVAPAFAQTSLGPASPNVPESANAPRPTDPDAPSANSVDGTGTFSVNPPLATDPGLGGVKTGPSRTDMNAERDAATTEPQAAATHPDPGPQLPAST